jgi:hypothetical protein
MVLRNGFCGGGTVLGLLLLGSLHGCAVVAVADAAVTVGVTAVKVGATVVETAVDVTAAGVKAAVHAGDKE